MDKGSQSACSLASSQRWISRHRYLIAPFRPRPNTIGRIPASCNHLRTDDRWASRSLDNVARLTVSLSNWGCFDSAWCIRPSLSTLSKSAFITHITPCFPSERVATIRTSIDWRDLSRLTIFSESLLNSPSYRIRARKHIDIFVVFSSGNC